VQGISECNVIRQSHDQWNYEVDRHGEERRGRKVATLDAQVGSGSGNLGGEVVVLEGYVGITKVGGLQGVLGSGGEALPSDQRLHAALGGVEDELVVDGPVRDDDE
jgi:hypothetical protein